MIPAHLSCQGLAVYLLRGQRHKNWIVVQAFLDSGGEGFKKGADVRFG